MTAAGAACHDPTDNDYGQHRNHDTSCSTPWHGSHSRQVPQVLRLQPGYFALPPFPQNQFSAYLLNQCRLFGQRARGHVNELEAQVAVGLLVELLEGKQLSEGTKCNNCRISDY